MKLYLMRAARYTLRIIILLCVVFAALYFLGMLDTGGEGLLKALFLSKKGAILLVVLLFFALTYPKWNFAEIVVRADLDADRERITEAFREYRYSLSGVKDGVLTFRSDSPWKRFSSMFDDTITVSREGDGYIRLEGMRRDLPRVELRLNSLMNRE